MDLTSSAKKIALTILLLIAIIIPFVTLGAVSNTTATPTFMGMPSTAWNLLLVVVIVVFAFGMIQSKK